MRLHRVLFVFALLVLVAPTVKAVSPERVLDNPIWLSKVGDAPRAYLSYSPDIPQFMAAYTEYDAYAKGHGGFMVRHHGEPGETILTAVVAKDVDNLNLAVAINWAVGSESAWLLDLGAAYSGRPVEIYVGVHNIPFIRWKDAKGRWHFSAGIAVDVTEHMSIGLEAHLLEDPMYRGNIRFVIRPDLQVEVYALYQGSEVTGMGVDACLTKGSYLLRVGYQKDSHQINHYSLGVGVVFP